MIIQINTDKTLNGDDKMQKYFTAQVKESLDRYESHVTRVEVHLKDEDGNKDGFNKISCLLEARLKGRKPIAITSQADTVELALSGAISKIETAIETIVGRIQKH